MADLRKYGVNGRIKFSILDLEGQLITSDLIAVGDTTVSVDDGSYIPPDNEPIYLDNGEYFIDLSASELTSGRVSIKVIDQTVPKAFLDQTIEVETYGNASAQHPFDLGSAEVPLLPATQTQIDDIETDTGDTNTKVTNIESDVDAITTQVNDIHSKLPLSGLISNLSLSDDIDGETFGFTLEVILAMARGRMKRDEPSPGQVTVYKSDNLTPLIVFSIDTLERLRLL